MAIITLTTDLGLKDYYVSSIKGAILSQCPDVKIVDITHNLPRFDIAQAAFIIRNVRKEFPSGTIHIIGVMPAATPETPHIAVETEGQYFIGADNGMFSLIFDRAPEKIVELTISQDTDFLTFPTKDIFVKAACHIARGGTLEVIGGPKDAVLEKSTFQPVVDAHTIKGSVIYIDYFGNVITNITHQLFKDVRKGRDFFLACKDPSHNIKELSKNYSDVPVNELVALFGATGFLEIGINIGNASKLLKIELGDVIRIEFNGNKDS